MILYIWTILLFEKEIAFFAINKNNFKIKIDVKCKGDITGILFGRDLNNRRINFNNEVLRDYLIKPITWP
jgi:hypothetical protein